MLCLLPSPLLGPACWRAAGACLADAGWEVAEVPSAHEAIRTGDDAMSAFLAAIAADREVVLVAHSNAGLFVPLLANARRRVTGYVFTDAGLPGRNMSQVPMIPAGFYDMIAGLSDDNGLLPGWTTWWGEEDLSGLFPGERVRAEVEAEQRRLPLSYFAETLPVPADWPSRPGGYLAFGDGYAAELATAREFGWPVRTLAGEHLHMLVKPDEVAAAIADLVREFS